MVTINAVSGSDTQMMKINAWVKSYIKLGVPFSKCQRVKFICSLWKSHRLCNVLTLFSHRYPGSVIVLYHSTVAVKLQCLYGVKIRS